MRIPGRRKVRKAGRWLQSRFRRGALILGYHRIADAAYDPYRICVSPDHFAQQLAVLREMAAPLPMADLLQGLKRGQLPRGALALTFDDGYQDNLTNAVPLLQEYQMPATVFLITGFPGREFWWDELARLLQTPLGLLIAANIIEAPDPLETAKQNLQDTRLLMQFYDRLLWKPQEQREVIFNALRLGQPDSAADDPEIPRALNVEEIRALAHQPGIEIGAHTINHPLLKYLEPDVQRREITGSKQHLEELLSETITGFSYPNGSLSNETEQIVQEAGFGYACCSVENVCYPASGHYALPRFWVPDIPGPAFARWLRRWLR